MQERPYAPGWLDRLIDWIDRMPGPNWVYPLALLVAQFLWVSGLLWWNGVTARASYHPSQIFVVAIAPYLLWMRFYLDGVAAAYPFDEPRS